MFVLNSKKIIIIIILIIIGLSAFILNYAKDDAMAVSALGESDRVVVLDAGHGAPDFGTSTKDGVVESTLNLQVALLTQEILEQNDVKVIMTRVDENCIADSSASTIREKKNSDLKNRVEIANTSNADLLVSIHMNYITQSEYWGWQTFYVKGSENGKRIADLIQDEIANVISDRDNKREVMTLQNKYIMEKSNIPACIVECGFMSNAEEAALLQQPEYQQKLAQGIANGIIEYFE